MCVTVLPPPPPGGPGRRSRRPAASVNTGAHARKGALVAFPSCRGIPPLSALFHPTASGRGRRCPLLLFHPTASGRGRCCPLLLLCPRFFPLPQPRFPRVPHVLRGHANKARHGHSTLLGLAPFLPVLRAHARRAPLRRYSEHLHKRALLDGIIPFPLGRLAAPAAAVARRGVNLPTRNLFMYASWHT